MGVQDRDWYQEGRGEATGGARSPATRSSYHPIAIIFAALLGAGAVSIGVHAYLEWRARVAIEQVMRVSNEVARKMQMQIAQQQREEAARRQAQKEQLDRQEALKVQAIRERQSAEEDARRATLAEADRKERAWAKFYRKPPSCNEAATMECANGFIRAKRTFEEKYARGDL